jgi:hypothetical protein
VPVVAELLTSAGRPTAGVATTLGEPTSYRVWAFAAAKLSSDSTDSYRIVNLNDRPAKITTTLVGAAKPSGPAIEVAPNSSATLDLAASGATPGVMLLVESDRPVFVARTSTGPGITTSPGLPVR